VPEGRGWSPRCPFRFDWSVVTCESDQITIALIAVRDCLSRLPVRVNFERSVDPIWDDRRHSIVLAEQLPDVSLPLSHSLVRRTKLGNSQILESDRLPHLQPANPPLPVWDSMPPVPEIDAIPKSSVAALKRRTPPLPVQAVFHLALSV
jgi:hypothetical protein